jgi:hypothetical protein
LSYHAYALPADVVQPAKTFMDDLKTKLIDHAAWEFVEEVAGTGSRITQVFKCLGTVNSFGTDFFVGVTRMSLTGAVGFIIGETYDSGAKTFGKGAVAANTALTVAADGSYGTARHVANENRLVAATVGFLACGGSNSTISAGMTMPTTGQTYYESISNDRIVIGSFNGTDSVYVGLYESFHAVGVDPFPLVVLGNHGTAISTLVTAAGYGAFTRDLKKAGTSSAGAWSTVLMPVNGDFVPCISRGAGVQANMTGKEQISMKYFPGRVIVGEAASHHALRGVLRDVLSVKFETAASGDTLSVDGVTHTVVGYFSHWAAMANSSTLAFVNSLLVPQNV